MPELPEVETVRAWLSPGLVGAKLDAVTLRRHDLRYPIPVERVHALEGKVVTAIRRRAKYLLFDWTSPTAAPVTMMVHLGMAGRCWLDHGDQPPSWGTHEHWRMSLSREGQRLWLRYQDARRFGSLDVFDSGAGHRLLEHLGPEPLGERWSGDRLYRDTRRSQQAIKVALMDARRVVGVGNIYASEACWRAQIDPRRKASRVGRQSCEALVDAVRAVLNEAIAAGGTTLRDFVGGDQNPGYFQQRLDVYGRVGQPCNRCGGTLSKGVLGQRSTFWCAACQR